MTSKCLCKLMQDPDTCILTMNVVTNWLKTQSDFYDEIFERGATPAEAFIAAIEAAGKHMMIR